MAAGCLSRQRALMIAAPVGAADLAAAQCGVLTTGQAVAAFGEAVLRAQLAGRRWQRPVRGVIVVHNGPLTDQQRIWVALLSCPARASLAGLTAANWDGLDGFADDPIHVALPPGTRRPAHPEIHPHWSTQLDDRDVHPQRLPRRTRLARSLVDAASEATYERRARAIILASVQQGLVRPANLETALDRRGNCARRDLVAESILDAEGGAHSLPERDFDLIRRRLKLPPPTRQSVRRRRDGRYYLDAEWERYGTACEIHGIPHMLVRNWDADLERANEILIAGPRLLIFSSYAIRHLSERVGDQLLRALRRGGYRR